MGVLGKIAGAAKAAWDWAVSEVKMFFSWLAKHGIKLYIESRKAK